MAGTGSSYSPDRLYAAVDELRSRAFGVQRAWGREAERRMRQEARWQDRNGPSLTGDNARQSLHAETLSDADAVVTTLYSDRQTTRAWRGWTGAPLGLFLERGTRNPRTGGTLMPARPVIWPVARSMAPDLVRRLKQVIW